MSTTKSPQDLLKAYKKSNKQRRLAIIAKANLKTEGEYFLYLNILSVGAKNPVKTTAKIISRRKGKIPTIHNVHILDASGSMRGGKLQNAVRGINEEIEQLKKDKTVNYTQTIVDFSSFGDRMVRYFMSPIDNIVEKYTCHDRGMTALYDAIGLSLEGVRDKVKTGEKVLVKIFTDGGENDSRSKWRSPSQLNKFVKELEEVGFTITFVGTKQDVAHIVKALSIDESNTLVHDNTPKGVERSFAMGASATMSYAADLKAGKDVSRGFYSKKIGTL